LYNTDGVSKDVFLDVFNRVLAVRPEGVGYIEPANMLPFVRKVQSELATTTGLDSSSPDSPVSAIIGTTQAVNFLKDYGGVLSGPLLAKGFAEAWGIGVAFGILIEQERQSQIAGTDELTKMLNWKAELVSEFEIGRHLAIKL
jgi:hypothetical protein